MIGVFITVIVAVLELEWVRRHEAPKGFIEADVASPLVPVPKIPIALGATDGLIPDFDVAAARFDFRLERPPAWTERIAALVAHRISTFMSESCSMSKCAASNAWQSGQVS